MSATMIWSEKSDFELVDAATQLPFSVRREFLALKCNDKIESSSLKLFRSTSLDSHLITCLIKRETLVVDPIENVGDAEPIAFLYGDGICGTNVPSIWSERADFPRALPHLNPVPATLPASLCISRASTQELYDRGGIFAIADRVSQWLTDAAYGHLDKDGWEPIIVSDSLFNAQLPIARIQELANASNKAKINGAFSAVAQNRSFIDSRANALYLEIVETSGIKQERYKGKSIKKCDLLLSGRSNRVNQYSDRKIDTQEGLLEFASQCGLQDEMKNLIAFHLKSTNGNDFRAILIAVHRERELINSILGQSENQEARHVEIIGLMLNYTNVDSHAKLSNIWQLNLISNPSPALSAELSNNPLSNIKSAAFVGGGSVGSNMLHNHIKAGLTHATVIDYDSVMPHNPPRHALPPFYVSMNKAIALKYHLENYPGVTIKAIDTALEEKHIDALDSQTTGYIVDSSANINVRNLLSASSTPIPITSVSVADNGRLGILVSEDKSRTCRLNHLYPYLYDLAYEHRDIAAWLQNNTDQGEVTLGMGCATQTSRLSQATIEGLTSSYFNTLAKTPERDLAKIAVIVNDEYGLPVKTIHADIPAFAHHQVRVLENDETWTCDISGQAQAQLERFIQHASPIEAGGFLYGKMDIATNTMTIVRAINVKPLEASSTKCVLPPAHQSKEHRDYWRRTHGALQLLGTWHSHPLGSCAPSTTDNKLINGRKGNEEFLFGGMMLIIGKNHDVSITCIF